MILRNILESKEKLPLLQYVSNAVNQGHLRDFYQIGRKKRLSYLYHRTGEAQGPVDGHARDICGKFHFEPLHGQKDAKTKIKKAEDFVIRTSYKKKRFNWIKDALITGEGFLFISELSKEYARSMYSELKRMGSDADMSFRARGLIPMASTSVAVNHNDTDITGYTQTIYEMSGGARSERMYSKDKIMHLTFDTPPGKVEGWTPLYSIPLHMELLWLLWSNQYDFQEKGNHPDLVVMAEKLAKNSAAYERLESELKQYNEPGNSKHGTLLLSGDKFSLEQLQRMDSLQFKEVGMFITSLIASLFHYPQSRLSIKTEESAKGKDSSGGNEKFYYTIVEQKQDILTDLENNMFWIPYFGVRIVQDKSYKHDQIEEGTVQQMRVTNVQSLLSLLQQSKKSLSPEKVIDVFNGVDAVLEHSDLIDYEEPVMDMSGAKPQLSKADLDVNSMSKQDRQTKRKDELNRQNVDGKPNGITR